MLCQNLKLGMSVIPAQAGIKFPSLDPRLRGDDARLRGDDARLRGDDARLRGDDARLRGDDARLRGDDGLTKHWLLSGLQ